MVQKNPSYEHQKGLNPRKARQEIIEALEWWKAIDTVFAKKIEKRGRENTYSKALWDYTNKVINHKELLENIHFIDEIMIKKGVPINKYMDKTLPSYHLTLSSTIAVDNAVATIRYYPNTFIFEIDMQYNTPQKEKIIIDGQEVERAPVARSIKLHFETGERTTDSTYEEDTRFTKDCIENSYPYDDTILKTIIDKDNKEKKITHKDAFQSVLKSRRRRIESKKL